MNKLVFRVENVYEDDSVLSLVPEVDGSSLVTLTSAYESSRGYDPAGGYGGIVPAFFNYGDLSSYYLGARQWPAPGKAWLLGCDCGDVGCWPLAAQITVTDATVTWSNFQQPHRPARDYRGRGPFHFNRKLYDQAVQSGVSGLEQARPSEDPS